MASTDIYIISFNQTHPSHTSQFITYKKPAVN